MQDAITHLLNRTGFGPRPGDIERVRQTGISRYIDEQLHPERIDDAAAEARLASIRSLSMSVPQLLEKYPAAQRIARKFGMRRDDENKRDLRRQVLAYYEENSLNLPQKLLEELQSQKIIRAVHSERHLQEVLTDFWFNHFNIFWGKNADRWLTTHYEMNAIRPNVLGKFKDLLMATAKSPAMLFYLDNFLSSSVKGINENYAREVMELHTLGVDGGYTQKDVQEVARAFTGWSIDGPQRNGEFMFRPRIHDDGEKIVLGHKINAGGIKDGEMVIDILARHPGTAHFIATKLVRRFVSDSPPEPLVKRLADVFRKTDGDIREMLRTIFTSPEFNSAETAGSKTKTPFELAVSSIRALDGSTDGSRQLAQAIASMGQPLYQCQPPTGFPDSARHWMSNGSLVERLNFAVALSGNRIPGTTVRIDESMKSVALKLGSPEFQKR